MDNNVRRIGILAPPGNVAMERELPRYLPPGIVINHNRLSRPGNAISRESLVAMADSVDQAAHDLAQAHPEVIVYGCTSGSFLHGIGNEADIAKRITQRTSIPAVTTSTAVIEALRAVGGKRVFMVTPYPDDVNEHEVAFLNHYGITVAAYDSFRCMTSEEIRAVASERVSELVLRHRAVVKKCDALFVSCTNLLVMDQIDYLERELNVPVVTSNQASLWAALQRMKVGGHDSLCGRLLKLGGLAPLKIAG